MRRPSSYRCWLPGTCCCLALLWAGPSLAQDPLRPQQRQQRQADNAALARQLVSGVLDQQLEQLRENGLAALPVYGEILLTRESLHQLAQDQMPSIIALLREAEDAPETQRDNYSTLIRQQSRQIAEQLMIQREQLRQRRQVAAIHEQTRQLIRQLQRVQDATARLPALPRDQRDRAMLAALEDQRDASLRFRQFHDSLAAIQKWDGTEGQTATQVLNLLDQHQTEQLFLQAEQQLSSGEVAQAATSQQAILSILVDALEQLLAVQGLDAQHDSTLGLVRDLQARQKELMDDTAATDAEAQQQLDELSGRQQTLAQQLESLRAAHQVPDGEPLLARAIAAAREAETQLFSGDPPAALEQQRQVLQQLGQLEALLQTQQLASENAAPGDDPVAQLDQLQQLDESLGALSAQQQEVIEQLEHGDDAAARSQQEVADDLAQQAQRAPLPESVQQAVQQAADQAQQAQESIRQQAPRDQSLQATRDVQQAIHAAQTQVSAERTAAREALQQAQNSAPAQSALAQQATPQTAAGESKSSTARLDPRRDGAAEPVRSDMLNPQAVASQRQVGEAQRAAAGGALPTERAGQITPWFTRLPPALREALRTQGRRPPPRGYEERLQRYFENSGR